MLVDLYANRPLPSALCKRNTVIFVYVVNTPLWLQEQFYTTVKANVGFFY